jgi:ribosomal protein S4
VRPGEVVALKNVTRENFNVKRNLDVLDRTVPGWLETGENGFSVTVRIVPQREQIDESIKRAAHRRAVLQVTEPFTDLEESPC